MEPNPIYFSIIIPLYNKENSISKTIESVLNQRYGNFELIIVNDGSTDKSFDIAKQIIDNRIRFFDKKNEGVSSARNKGIELANCEWICFLDADDIFLPNYLETHVKLIEKYPNYKVFTVHHAQSKRYIKSFNYDFVVNDFLLENSKSLARTSQQICCVGTVVIHKECFSEVGCFNVNATHGEDLDMWYRLSLNYKFVKSYIVSFYYNQLAENRATHKEDKATVNTFPNKNAHSYYSYNLYKACLAFWYLINNYKSRKKTFCCLKNVNIIFILFYINYVIFYRLKYKFSKDIQIFYAELKENGKFFFEK